MEKKPVSLTKAEKKFVESVWDFYHMSGRHDLPWRKTNNPYKIVVSELMLQQTQVVRVLPKYKAFLKQFPSTKVLAQAPLGEVLKAWQGLGYNRRAKFLWQAAQAVVDEHKEKWPKTFSGLQSLSGIGSYTAGAVMNFAYNSPVPLIETNVRTIYIHHFFKDAQNVSDKELLPIIERTLDTTNPRAWNWALMDYGSHLKAIVGNVSTKSKTYKKQTNFKESNRFVRGAVIRALSVKSLTKAQLGKSLSEIEPERIVLQLQSLEMEGLVVKVKNTYCLP
jgi:A/G-specific adenine glycosylase